MWKLVLCAVLAAVPVEPGLVLTSPFIGPLTYSSAFVAPAVATITKQASSVVHPSPYLGHFIKKRSASGTLLPAPYIAPTVTYTSPLLYNTFAAPAVLPAAPIPYSPIAYTHFIKKRSVQFTTPYLGAPRIPYVPQLYAPYVAHLLPAGEVYTPGLYRHPHVIKKRTLDILTSIARWLFSSN